MNFIFLDHPTGYNTYVILLFLHFHYGTAFCNILIDITGWPQPRKEKIPRVFQEFPDTKITFSRDIAQRFTTMTLTLILLFTGHLHLLPS